MFNARLVEDLSDTHGTEITLSVIPRRDEHILVNGKLYLVNEVAHWSTIRNPPAERPHVTLQVSEAGSGGK
jgi:hypothetical protein